MEGENREALRLQQDTHNAVEKSKKGLSLTIFARI